jgi:hypothetical protein
MSTPDIDEAVIAQDALRRRLWELEETQRWVHHVADLDSGEVLTTPLDRPVAPLSRTERLSRLGHTVGPPIPGGPKYRLTPRKPYQAAPEASLIVSGAARLFSYSSTQDEVVWQPPRDATGFDLGGMRVFFAESPDGRSLVSIVLSGKAWSGTVGHVLMRETQAGASVRIPITDAFAAHTVDLTFIPRVGELSDVIMSLEAGIELLTFSSISFGPLPPVIDPATF